MPQSASFYFDLASPYSYLASARVDSLLGHVTWCPILVGAVHRHYRRVSWGTTSELRARGIAEIEARALTHGLAPIVWPKPYPANSLTAMRAVTWAAQQGYGRTFAQAAFIRAFRHGIDLSLRHTILDVAEHVGLDANELDRRLDDPDLKQALHNATDRAIQTGVYGVPTFDAGGLLWWGDHQLSAAAAHHKTG